MPKNHHLYHQPSEHFVVRTAALTLLFGFVLLALYLLFSTPDGKILDEKIEYNTIIGSFSEQTVPDKTATEQESVQSQRGWGI